MDIQSQSITLKFISKAKINIYQKKKETIRKIQYEVNAWPFTLCAALLECLKIQRTEASKQINVVTPWMNLIFTWQNDIISRKQRKKNGQRYNAVGDSSEKPYHKVWSAFFNIKFWFGTKTERDTKCALPKKIFVIKIGEAHRKRQNNCSTHSMNLFLRKNQQQQQKQRQQQTKLQRTRNYGG